MIIRPGVGLEAVPGCFGARGGSVPPAGPLPALARPPRPSAGRAYLLSLEERDAHAHREHRPAHHPRAAAELRQDLRRPPGPRPDRDPDPELRAVPPGRPAGRERDDAGLEGVFREIFPIESYDKTLKLEYIKFDLGKPRYEPDECRQLRLSYGRPLHVWLRLNKGETALEESVYLGDMPIMIGGGEFIINGAERVVVSQLHRSPGVDFVVDIEAGDKKLHACRVIPERGSWIELQVTKKDTLGVRIDQSGKFSSMTLLRAMSPMFSSDDAILKAFYEAEDIDTDDRRLRRARRPDRLRRRGRPQHRRGPDRLGLDDLQGLGAGAGRRQDRRHHAS